jgi:hypothetical protein
VRYHLIPHEIICNGFWEREVWELAPSVELREV